MIDGLESFVSVAGLCMGGGIVISVMAWLIGWSVDAALRLFHA